MFLISILFIQDNQDAGPLAATAGLRTGLANELRFLTTEYIRMDNNTWPEGRLLLEEKIVNTTLKFKEVQKALFYGSSHYEISNGLGSDSK